MPGQTYKYLGYAVLGYPDYADAGDGDRAGKMLVAEPGGSYEIRAINDGAPVPPDDDRWDPPYARPGPDPGPGSGGGTVLHGEPGRTVGGQDEGAGQ